MVVPLTKVSPTGGLASLHRTSVSSCVIADRRNRTSSFLMGGRAFPHPGRWASACRHVTRERPPNNGEKGRHAGFMIGPFADARFAPLLVPCFYLEFYRSTCATATHEGTGILRWGTREGAHWPPPCPGGSRRDVPDGASEAVR